MPWIPPELPPPKGRRGGERAIPQRIRCDQCSCETKHAYWGVNDSRKEAGVWWRARFLQGTSEPAAWCPRCASAACEAASQSYEDTGLDVESVMSAFWMDPTGRAVVPANTTEAATEHRDQGPPRAPLPSASSSQAHRGRVPPKAPPPGISLMTIEERLAALEEEVAKLQLQVAKLQKHPSDAAVG